MSGSNPGFQAGDVPTAGEWNFAFSQKQDSNPILDAIVAAGGSPATVPPSNWVPFDASGGSLILTVNAVTFTQIGNIVFVSGSVTYPTNTDLSSCLIGGLPVSAANAAYGVVDSVVGNTALLAIHARTVQNSTTFSLKTPTGSTIVNAQLSGQTVNFCLIYPDL